MNYWTPVFYDHHGPGVLPLYDAGPGTWVWDSKTLTGTKGKWLEVKGPRVMIRMARLRRDRFETELRRRALAHPTRDGYLFCSVLEVDDNYCVFGICSFPNDSLMSQQARGLCHGNKGMLKYSLPAYIWLHPQKTR